MPFDLPRARPLLQAYALPKLFIEELGWEPCRNQLDLTVGAQAYVFSAFAQKQGFVAWQCESPDGGLPDHATRLRLDRMLSESSFEHLIVFVTRDRVQQSWTWVRRETGKPLAARTHEYHRGQPGDSLLQKLQHLFVSLEEEEAGLSTVVVAGRARAAFDIERVTKAFYRDFDTHRLAFLKFIDGIGEVADREWYASVMLNRLMFVYFIQRKGFLDGDTHYLRNRLARCQQEQGKDKFYSFYRFFLLRLFHEGFGKRRQDRTPALEQLLGNIPYLNGGLFDVHELERPERYGDAIQIPDKAFERIFDYFDSYQWHLDERPLRKDNEINPDVLGYIFEKYINQKQMGAYYTKEDITEYISKNTVLPFLFDAARGKCKVAFDQRDGPSVWDLLRDNPDRYIYDAVKKGVALPLPAEIALGVDATAPDLITRRKPWNTAAPADYAMPTETGREAVARRQRYGAVRSKLAAGEVRDINDFITLNLDLRQFAQDVLQTCEGPDLLMAFWQSITGITVLDPTGGSGAFIFAALNILDPLYEACLDRMEAFLAEWGAAGRKHHPNYSKKFTEVLERLAAHPNRRYFVLKSIILNNLYAVDIMEEAVEICKLRLFLKLAAQVEPDAGKDNLGIEPLPDIDFNIRAGNTLVGYATYDEVKKAVTSGLDFDDAMGKIAVKAADLQQTFDTFRRLQTEGDGTVPAADKLELQRRLRALEEELNRHLAGEYGVRPGNKKAYANWLKTHQPFHWFIEFYGILMAGGFDVVVGNPPYVEWSKIKLYKPTVGSYSTLVCGNIYTAICERSYNLLGPQGRFGMIVPISSVATARMAPFRDVWLKQNLATHASHYSGDAHPSVLFNGVKFRLSILLQTSSKSPRFFSTCFQRWYAEARESLFPLIEYAEGDQRLVRGGLYPKIWPRFHRDILAKLCRSGHTVGHCVRESSDYPVFAHRIVAHFVKAMDFVPYFSSERDGEKRSEDYKVFAVDGVAARASLACILNSSLFYSWFVTYTDVYHCGRESVLDFPVDVAALAHRFGVELGRINEMLMSDLRVHCVRRSISYQATGLVQYDEFYPRRSKNVVDEIDVVLAEYFGLTAEELDFVLNFDIKFRLGRGADSVAEAED